jgi:hypothetical protein
MDTFTVIEAVVPFEVNIAIEGWPAGSEFTARSDKFVFQITAIKLCVYLHCSGV